MSDAIRGSGVSAYLACPAYGIWRALPENQTGPVHAGTLCGTMAHGIITGQQYEMPKMIKWDGDTQSYKDLEWQAESIANAVQDWIGKAKVLQREYEVGHNGVSGHIDLVLRRGCRVEIVDLKTGHRKPGTATWTQLAVYASLYRQRVTEEQGINTADDVVLLWVPRVKRGMDQPLRADTRPAPLLADMGKVLALRATMLAKGAEVRIPGDHCRYCGIDACLMRMRSESQMEGNNT